LAAQKERMAHLEIEEERYRTLVEKARLAVVVAQDGVLKYVTPQACLLVGRTADELLSRPLEAFIHPHDHDLVLGRHKRRLGGEPVPETCSYRVLYASGSAPWVEISVKTVMGTAAPPLWLFLPI
jgi:PAS domain S-box-containing protein